MALLLIYYTIDLTYFIMQIVTHQIKSSLLGVLDLFLQVLVQ